jgi:CBS domain-containing protein
MVTVSERAKARLLEQKRAANLDGEADGLRVAAGPSRQWILVADQAREDDQIFDNEDDQIFDNTVIRNERRRSVVTSHMTVEEMMTPHPIALPQTASVFDAAQKMRDASIGNVVVLDGQKVCGIVTDRDIVVRAIATGREPRSTKLTDICSRELTTLSPEDSVETAVRLMRQHAVRRLPVVKGDRPVGILTLGDLAIEKDGESALADVSAAPPNV